MPIVCHSSRPPKCCSYELDLMLIWQLQNAPIWTICLCNLQRQCYKLTSKESLQPRQQSGITMLHLILASILSADHKLAIAVLITNLYKLLRFNHFLLWKHSCSLLLDQSLLDEEQSVVGATCGFFNCVGFVFASFDAQRSKFDWVQLCQKRMTKWIST